MPLTTFKRGQRKKLKASRFIPNPEWEDSEECRELVEHQTFMQHEGFTDYYPEEHQRINEEGSWVMVHTPPNTEYTVPPFSIWFATPWPMDCCQIEGVRVKRVKIITPKGSLGLYPREYSVVKDLSIYLGREAEGILFHRMDGEPVLDSNVLHYMQSRGIRKADACMMLLGQMKSPNYGWLEVAPPYGEHYGKEWPSSERCPFATPRKSWIILEDKK